MALSSLIGMQIIVPVVGAPGIIEAPTEKYPTIQAAINVANAGDTILVHAGTYYEHLIINKSLRLIGEDKSTTIIDANGTSYVMYVTANNVRISGFTIQKGWYYDGIYLYKTHGNVIEDNIFKHNLIGIYVYNSRINKIINNRMTNNQYGVRLYSSSGNTIANNTITSTLFYSISLYGGSSENSIYGNTVLNNNCAGSVGIHISNDDPDNTIYHNSFINNTIQAMVMLNQTSTWDNGTEGNYWSDYEGEDTNGDGIGDTPYIIDENNQDNHPLMRPYWY